MTTVYDIPAKELIDEIAKKLENDSNIYLPDENKYSKTAVNRENPPEPHNWWYIRCASILRKIYMNNGIGIENLKAEYGGRKDRGSKPHAAASGSGTITRRAVQQLEKAGFVSKIKGKGRIITSKGQAFLDKSSKEVLNKIKNNYPGLEKY